MRRAALIALLILASCAADSQTTSTEPPAPTLTTLGDAVPVDTSTSTTTTPSATTTSTTTTTTTLPPNAAAAFGLTQIVFGDSSFVVITNWGNDTGSLNGHWLCQSASYMALPDIALGPGEQILVGLATSPPPELAGMTAIIDLGPAIGVLSPDSGEVALYDAAAFEDSTHLVTYVAWGEADHSRLSLAIEAGVWEAGSVEVFDDAPSISSGVYPATSNLSWFADIGG